MRPICADALITRPRGKVCDPALSWAIWYPLRRAGSFEQLSAQEQRVILMEHGGIGHAFGRAGWAQISAWPVTGWIRTTTTS